jgi:hypothetical protein
VVIEFDHSKLVSRDLDELRRFRRWVLSSGFEELTHGVVVHAGDCCEREAWASTCRQIIEALHPNSVVVVNKR